MVKRIAKIEHISPVQKDDNLIRAIIKSDKHKRLKADLSYDVVESMLIHNVLTVNQVASLICVPQRNVWSAINRGRLTVCFPFAEPDALTKKRHFVLRDGMFKSFLEDNLK